VIDGLEAALSNRREPGLTELRGVLLELLDPSGATGWLVGEHRFKRSGVYRLQFQINSQAHALVVKRLDPAVAQHNQLVATRWLPALGLDQSGPALLGVAAERTGQCVWHIYEDLGDQRLDTTNPEQGHVEAAVDLIARLHVGFAGHALLAECRLHGGDLGMASYTANIRDAIRGLESLQPTCADLGSEQMALRDRLLRRLPKLLDEAPDRARAMAELGGPETLLHGDLWPTNILTVPSRHGLQARLIDWDKAGVGPPLYDLSTLLYRFSAEYRPWILNRYQQAVASLGWRLPSPGDLNLLLETAEISRLANCLLWPCIAALETPAAWTFNSLAMVEDWFESIAPAI
jgi:Phosphotransferase enzyme family